MKEGWSTTRLDAVCEFRGGGTPSKSVGRYWVGDIPWVSPKDVKSAIVSDSIDHISQEAIDSSATSLIPKDSVLIVVRSGILARTIPIAMAGRDLTVNQDLKALCPNPEVNARFLYYLLGSKMDVLLSMVSRGATVHRLTTEQIRSLPFDLPPLPEQQRIVGVLDGALADLSTLRAHAEKNLQNARKLFESHLQSVFTQRGAGWVERKLGELAEFKNGLNFTRQSRGQTVRIVGVGDFQENAVVPSAALQSITIDGKLSDEYLIRRGDILTVRSNGSKDLVGRCMLVPETDGKTSYSGFIIRIRCNTATIDPRFLLHYLKSSAVRTQLTRDGGGANISNINQAKLSELPVALPSLNQQQLIADKLDASSAEAQRLQGLYQKKLVALAALEKSLLYEAFSGAL